MDDLEDQLCRAGQELYRQGLIAGVAGNLSARLVEGGILVTRAGTHKGKLAASDLVVVASGSQDPSDGASSELPMHRACYAANPSTGAVIHAHAPALIAAGLKDLRIVEHLPELELATGVWATIELLPSGSQELGRAVGYAVAGEGRAERRSAVAPNAADPERVGTGVLLLRNHGAVTVGPTVESALHRMELAELSAYAVLLAEHADGPAIRDRVARLIEVLAGKKPRF